ncbi:MAG: sigma-70 family RNA polymerase sigma factor [Planctomycetes bacterium]|nr:sigma-70 family RNA polymerase sigma factor [Planctomycetota bacterium]
MTMTCPGSVVNFILDEEPHLHSVARRLTRCESDSDDLVQETLLRAYHARDRFQPGTSARAWTTTILRRLFLTGAVRAKRAWMRTDTDACGPLGVSVARAPAQVDANFESSHDRPAPDIRTLGDGMDDVVKNALDRVPDVYRTTFLLSVVRGMSYEEIGRQLGVPLGTVMSRIHRARERLKGDLGPHRRELAGSGLQRRCS